MLQAVKSNLFLYDDGSCLIVQGKDVIEIEKELNGDFNRISIHFGENKTKSILFASKRKIKKLPKLNISYKIRKIKQHSKVTYLGCILDKTISGESMALKVINKINSRLKFLHGKNKFLTPALRRLLCNGNVLIHVDYASPTWYPKLTPEMKRKAKIKSRKINTFGTVCS